MERKPGRYATARTQRRSSIRLIDGPCAACLQLRREEDVHEELHQLNCCVLGLDLPLSLRIEVFPVLTLSARDVYPLK